MWKVIEKHRGLVLVGALLGSVLVTAGARATEPDAAVIERITGRKPEVAGSVLRVSVPRADLAVRVDGVALAPFQGLTTWAAFQAAGSETMMMGDVVVTEDEADAALDAALDHGLEVTALHNHFSSDAPRVFFMHIGGHATTERLASGVKAILVAVEDVAAKRAAGSGGGTGAAAGRIVPAAGSIDAAPLEAILKAPAQAKDGMAKFVVGRTVRMHGVEVGAAMGINTWAVFGGSAEAAVVDGDFAMLDGEVQNVLRALRRGRIEIVALHNHMLGEEPRVTFLHFWGTGRATDLAATLRTALDAQAS